MGEELPEFHKFNLKLHTSIWFNTNPDEFMPRKVQDALIKRKKLMPESTIRLIYSSSILTRDAREEFLKFAREHHFDLVDIQSINSESPLWPLILQELQFNEGGNPAAASDLGRWIPELIDEGIYVDIDLPIKANCLAKITALGSPIRFNMGSVLSPPNHSGQKKEAVALNTDIIAYSSNRSKTGCPTKKAMQHIAQKLADIYNNPYAHITETEWSEADFFKHCKREGSDICTLRRRVKEAIAFQSLGEFYNFLGHVQFFKLLNIPGIKRVSEIEVEIEQINNKALARRESVKRISEVGINSVKNLSELERVKRINKIEKEKIRRFNEIEVERARDVSKIVSVKRLIEGGRTKEAIASLLNREISDDEWNEIELKKLNELQNRLKQFYKKLVMDITGPGAIHKILGGNKVFSEIYRNERGPAFFAPSCKAFVDASYMAPFVSDNIPPWETKEEDLPSLNLNSGGLTWIPN